MSIKKSLKKSLVLGALMSFVITGNAYADSVKVVEKDGGLLGKTYSFEYYNDQGNLVDTYSVSQVLTDSDVRNKVFGVIGENLNDYINSEDLQTQIGGLKNQIADLTGKLNISQEQLDAANKLYQDTKNQLDELTKNYADTQKQLADAQKAAETAAAQIKELQQALADGEITEAEYEKQLAAAQKAAETAATQITDLTSKLNISEQQLADAQKAAETAAAQIKELTKNYELSQEALNKQITDLQNQLKQYEELKEVLGSGDLTTALANLKEVKDDLHKVASLAGTIDETIKEAKAKAAEYEALARENAALVKDKLADYETALSKNINYTEKVLTKKLNDVESKLNTYEDFVTGKLGDVENKLNQYEDAIVGQLGAIDKNIGALEDKVQQNVNTIENVIKTELKEQAAILKDVQEKTTDITFDGKDTTTVGNNLAVGKDLTVGGNASVGGNLDVAGDAIVAGTLTAKDVVSDTANIKDLTVGNSIIVNEGKANQVQIDENGIKVGLNSVTITGNDVTISATASSGEIKLSTLGDITKLDDEVKAPTVVEAINKEVTARKEADTALQNQITSNAEAIASNATAIKQNAEAIGQNADAIKQNATAIGQNADAIKAEESARENADTALQGQITNNAQDIAGLNQRLGKLNGKLNKVGAGAAALAALHPLEYDPDDKLTFSAGMGNYAGQNAAALGAFYRPNEKLMFSLAGTMGNGEDMVNLGVSIGLDGATGLAKMSKKELIQKVNSMEAEMAELRALVVKLAADKK